MRRLSIIALVLVLCAACGHKKAESSETPPPLLVDQRGTVMPLEKAVTHLSFRPYIPSSQVLAFAVLPPIGGADNDRNRGLGVEYLAGRDAMVLSEWPKQQFTVAFGHGQPDNCVVTHYAPQAVAWTTPGNLVMTLIPDGSILPSALDREAARLIRAGACPR